MENLSSELKRINKTLIIMMVIILISSCMRINVNDDSEEYYNTDWDDERYVIETADTEKMVDLGNGHFGIYTDYVLRIYYYDPEKNELILKKTKDLYEDFEEE